MFRTKYLLPLASLAIVAACADSPTSLAHRSAGTPSLLLSDASHTFGDIHFDWMQAPPSACMSLSASR